MIFVDHWELPPDRETSLAGNFYRGGGCTAAHPGAQTYRLLSHHSCGYHLVNADDPTDRRCASIDEIGTTYRLMREVPLSVRYCTSPEADEVRRRLVALDGRARVYFGDGIYHIEPDPRAPDIRGRYRRSE